MAVWAFGSYAERRERSKADERLTSDLASAQSAIDNELDLSAQQARALARSPAVQRALAHPSRAALRRFKQEHPGFLLTTGPSRVEVPGAATPSVEVFSGKRMGRVTAIVHLDARLARRVAEAARIEGDERLALADGGSMIVDGKTARLQSQPPAAEAADVRAGGIGYRAVAVAITEGSSPQLVVLKRSSSIDADADAARWRVAGLGFGLIATLLVVAYALAPALARSRLTRQQRDQAERVLAHVGDGVFLVDHEGVLRLWNPAAEAITGLRAETVCNRPAKETIPGWAAIAEMVPTATRPGDVDDASGAETVPFEVSGKELWLSMTGVALADGTVYAFRDVTSERRLEKLRSEFVATISHELRTPLASLHGAALTLREHGQELGAETQHDLLDMIAVQSRRLADLVDEILVTGQLDAGTLRVVNEAFDPEELVQTAASVARVRVDDGAMISVSTPAGLPQVAGDPDRTRQVLANLLDNAIKYSPDGGQIELNLDAEDGRVRFTIRDQGLGIPLGEQERIFDKFYRLDPDHRRGISGSGLGLYICRELVRSMNGRIWVESDPGAGATFVFELPVAAPATESVPARS